MECDSSTRRPAASEHAEGRPLLSRRSAAEKLERLRTMDCLVLDNTLRETTVGSLRGHTPQDKHQILRLVEPCGFTEYVIANFGDPRGADDVFAEELVASGRDLSRAWCFSELYDSFEEEDGTRRGRRPVLDTPHGLVRAASLGIPNVIIERDVVCRRTSWDRWSEEEEMAMFTRRVQFAQDHGLQRVLFNFRDFCVACAENMPWVIRLTRHVATLAQQFSGMVFGIIWEEPTGCLFPFEIVDWVSEVRAVMDDAGWREGHLLLHIHRGYGMSEAIVIECLAAGCTGIWCATCTNGAATGHACSAITLTNLARIGNTQICEKYCFHAIRRCAIEVCKIVTGAAPEVSTEVYGERALETVFDASSGMGGGSGGDPTELLCDMFGESRRMRISTMATPVMFQTKLMEIFGGTSEDYGIGLCWEMRSKMHEDLVSGRKEEYNTAAGLSALFERVGGTLTEGMVSRIVRENSFKSHPVLVELQAAWRRVLHGTDPAAFPPPLPFRVFYDRFMAKFVPCYSCQLADSLFGALLVTDDGRLRWEAVEMRACWALDEYGDEIANADDLFHVVFQKLLLPLAVERTMLRPGDKDVAAAGEEAKLVLSGDFVPTGSCKVARRKLFSITLRHGYESALLGASGSLNDWGGSTVSVGVGPSLARVGELGETRL
mmetsp:Transcript_16062/g.43682  ORF Transcript_16062/g.43682 Transcript_16062/m.43682 type:complete len:662 (-) Transcript_16062:27-2012(-)